MRARIYLLLLSLPLVPSLLSALTVHRLFTVTFGHDAEVKDGLLFARFNGTVIACSALLSCLTSSHLVLTSHPSKVHLMK